MKIIPVNSKTFGYHEILVDDENFELVSKHKWHIVKGRETFYAKTNIIFNNKKTNISMHRLILGLTDPKTLGDHKNHNGLDNQSDNIRCATYAQNQANKTSHKNSSSKYLGVCLSKIKHKLKNGEIKIYYSWKSYININGKKKSLGYFKSEEEAAKKYDDSAKIHHREFTNLNFK